MRKFTIIFVLLALVLSLSVPAFAYESGDKVEVSLTRRAAEPKYYVSIPASIELKLYENVYLDVTASDIANLGNKKVAITLDDALVGHPSNLPGGYSDTIFIVKHISASDPYPYYEALGYYIYGEIANGHMLSDPMFNLSLLEFTEDNTKQIMFYIGEISGDYPIDPSLILTNSSYTGWVIFGIKLVD